MPKENKSLDQGIIIAMINSLYKDGLIDASRRNAMVRLAEKEANQK